MAYVRTGGMSTAARRRRRRSALVMSGLLLFLVLALLIAFSFNQGWIGGDDSTGDTAAATSAGPTFGPTDITVNVYNSTGVPGLAGRTSDALEARGYNVANVANDPENETVEGGARIRYGTGGAEAAEYLQEQVPDAEIVEDARTGSEIDLVLGQDFTEFPELESTEDASATE